MKDIKQYLKDFPRQPLTVQEQEAYLQEREAEIRRTQFAARRTLALKSCGLKGDQWNNTFATYRAVHETQKKALLAAQKFIREWPNVQKGLMFWGEDENQGVGTGKDHLLHAICQEVLKKRGRVIEAYYWFSYDLADAIFSEWQYHKEQDTDVEQMCRECDLFLIGDLDKVCPHRVEAITESIWRIINSAESTGRPIICATGNTPEAGYKMSGPFRSRLADVFDWHEVKGEDARRKG